MSVRTRGVAVLCLLLLVAGCSSDLPALSDDDAAACAELTAALPDRVAGEDLSDDTDRTAAWGGIELTCGVELPAAYDDFASCSVVGDVGWFLPPGRARGPVGRHHRHGADLLAPRQRPDPAEHRGSDEVQAAIAAAITQTLDRGRPLPLAAPERPPVSRPGTACQRRPVSRSSARVISRSTSSG